MTRSQIVFVVCALVLSAQGVLADIGPAKPSDTVVLIASVAPQACGGANGEVFNTKLQPDGTTAPFALAAGQVLMITGIDYVTGNTFGGVPTGERIGFRLTTVTNDLIIAEGYAVNTGLPGAVSGNLTLSTPMRVNTGLCMDRTAGVVVGGTRTWIRGFVTQDK